MPRGALILNSSLAPKRLLVTLNRVTGVLHDEVDRERLGPRGIGETARFLLRSLVFVVPMVYPPAPFKVLYLQVIPKGRMKRKSETVSGAYSGGGQIDENAHLQGTAQKERRADDGRPDST